MSSYFDADGPCDDGRNNSYPEQNSKKLISPFANQSAYRGIENIFLPAD